MTKSYSELSKLKTFQERFDYLKTTKPIGESIFGYERFMNQMLYTGSKWKRARRKVIIRDEGNDLGAPDCPIFGPITVHHINPITIEQLEEDDPMLYDEENLISVSDLTHKALHYSDSSILPKPMVERKPGDTCPWKGG